MSNEFGFKRLSFFFHFLVFKFFRLLTPLFFSAYQFDKVILYILLSSYYKLECLLTWKKACFSYFHHEIVLSFFFYITVWRNVLRLCCWSTNAWNLCFFPMSMNKHTSVLMRFFCFILHCLIHINWLRDTAEITRLLSRLNKSENSEFDFEAPLVHPRSRAAGSAVRK